MTIRIESDLVVETCLKTPSFLKGAGTGTWYLSVGRGFEYDMVQSYIAIITVSTHYNVMLHSLHLFFQTVETDIFVTE